MLLAEDFADSGVLFVSYAHGSDEANHTRVIRTRFDGRQLLEVTPIFTTQPPKSGDAHFDGSVPEDNPFVGTANVKPEIYSYGHRHVQAIVTDRDEGVIYAHEHGIVLVLSNSPSLKTKRIWRETTDWSRTNRSAIWA